MRAPLTLLHIDASPRVERSILRRLSRAFVDAWLALRGRSWGDRRDRLVKLQNIRESV